MSARALKKMGARAPQNNGCAPSFFKRALHELILLWFLFIFMCVHSFVLYLSVLWIMSARALLNNGCSSTQKDGCSRPLKIMGARPHFFKRAFHKLYFLHVHLCPFTCALLSCIWMMSARALLNNGCSSPLKIMGARALKKMGARAP